MWSFLCGAGGHVHRGAPAGEGRVIVTCKANVPGAGNVIEGRWRVFRCAECGEPFSGPAHRLA